MAKGRLVPKAHREAIDEAARLAARHTLIGGLPGVVLLAGADMVFARDGFARVVVGQDRYATFTPGGAAPRRKHNFRIMLDGFKRCTPAEWLNLIAQCRLHVVLNHCDLARTDEAWRVACELEAMDLLRHLGIGQRHADLPYCEVALPGRKPAAMAAAIRAGGQDAITLFSGNGVAGAGQPGWVFAPGVEPVPEETKRQHTELFAAAVRRNIAEAVETAGAAARGPASARFNPNSMAEKARRWFVASYPLLASLAAAFEIVEDEAVCDQLGVGVAAVDSEARKIFVQPRFPWTPEAMRFAVAHELMHVGLRHEARRQGRDPLLWNIACDYVINGWLFEMGVGVNPVEDLMLDPELALEKDSAEAIYDRMARDIRLMRRLSKVKTLRGQGLADMISDRPARWWTGPGMDLDAFYRRALADGLDLHPRHGGRGLLPGALVEEIRALQQPPIPWDVKLGQWLDAYFPPLESVRSFRRASRRQSSTPDIPRAVYIRPPDLMAARTFGVVLDTSGSMPRRLLGQALGAIASYALAREVPLVRVVQCDAGVHDMGYVEPESLAGRVEVRGRGGTVLTPAIRLLMESPTFPKDAPLLVITDGQCDMLTIPRDHAFLMPEGARLPFVTRAPVFHFERGE